MQATSNAKLSAFMAFIYCNSQGPGLDFTRMENVTRTTLPDGRILKTERSRKSAGQVLRFTVLMPTHRIVGVAEIRIPLMEGFSLEGKLGPDKAKAIEDDLQALAVRVADAIQA